MLVRLDRERLVPTLIQMAVAGHPVMGMPCGTGVGHVQPAHEGGEIAVLAGPQRQIEVVGLEAVGPQSHVEASDGLVQDTLERRIVVIALEDSQSRIRRTAGIRLPGIWLTHTNPTRSRGAAALADALAVPHKTPRSRVGLILPVSSTPLSLGNVRPAGHLSRRHEKVAVVTLAAIIQAPSRKYVLNHYIWQCSATGRFMRISPAPKHNSM